MGVLGGDEGGISRLSGAGGLSGSIVCMSRLRVDQGSLISYSC